MNHRENKKEYFDLKKLFILLKKNFTTLLIWMFFGLAVSMIISLFFITPKYSSSVEILVNQKDTDSQTQFNTQQADLQVINTYKDVLKKSVVLEPVLKQARQTSNYQGTLSDLEDEVSISNENQSQVITVTVTDSNAYTARDIANSIGNVFTKKIKKMMQVNNVAIVSRAKAHTKPVSPNKPLNLLIGLVIGLIIGFVIIIVRQLLDTKVREVDFLTEDLGLVNLGIVFHMHEKNNFHVVQVFEKNSEEENITRRRV